MKGFFLLPVAVATAVVLWVSAAGAAQPGSGGPLAQSAVVGTLHGPLSQADGSQPRSLVGVDGVPAKGSYAFLLKLSTVPTGVAYYANLSEGRTEARAAARDQLSTVRAAESRVIAALPSGTQVLYQTHVALAGVAVYTNVANLPAMQRISGVAHVYPIAAKTPSNSYAVPLVRAPQAWQTYSDRGENTTIAVIDTGIDYTHADFGGPGTAAAYTTAHATEAAPANPALFPTSKIPGGYDLVGDSYNADPTSASYQPTPHPDTNPLDCNGHGSHTAGTAAGYGVNADGTTYTGSYSTSTPFSSMRIGPGMAPKAQIYAYRVFGCAGSSDVVGDAIDMAVDPNGDGNPADHVSVISMSLGADYASPQDGDAVLSNAASALGVSVVAAAGNAGDIYDVGGSPGNAQRVIGVAAGLDAYSQIDHVHVSAPAAIAGDYGAERSVAYDWANKPDLSGTVVPLTQSTNLDGCAPLNSTDAAAVNGKVAFLEWTDGPNRRCGSVARSTNVKNAGAIGFIFADDQEAFAAGITGSTSIPGVMVTKSAGDTIRSQLANGVQVSGTGASDFRLLIPADNDKVAGFTSRGIREAGNVKPDVTGIGVSVFSAANGTGNQGVSESGTSMATPMVAGLSALIRSKNAGWTPEQVKADIMNTAGQDLFTDDNHTGSKFAPNRVGAGRIDAKAALDNKVLAYVTDDPGAVSASFGPVAATGPTTLHKTIKLDNQGTTDETYDASYQAITVVPGAHYSVSPDQVTVAAGQSATVTLTLTIDPTKLTKTKDPTVAATQSGFPREFLADASGRVVFTPGDATPSLRVPVYSAPRPASTMTQPAALDMPSGAVQTTSLPLSGTGIHQGSGSTAIQSLVAGFELQAKSGALPACGGSVTSGCIHASDENAADLKYVGTTSNAPELRSLGDDPLASGCNADGQCGLEYFAISTQGPWHTAATENEYDIYIDSNGDGNPDYIAFNSRLSGTDILVANLFKLSTGKVVDTELINDRFGDTDTALFDSDTLVMPVWLPALGVTAGHSRITYGIVTFGSFSGDPVDSVGFTSDLSGFDGSLTTDVLNPGVAVFGSFDGSSSALLYADMPGTSLTLQRDAAAYAADKGQGVLMVHFHNVAGNKAQVVDIDSHSLSVTKAGNGHGTVTSSPNGVNCGSTCSGWFASGSSVTLTATPDADSAFAGWSGGGCSGTGTCTVTMDAAKAVTATFTDLSPTVTGLKVKVNHHKRTAKVTFHGSDPGNGSAGLEFQCKLDHKGFKSCSSPKLYKHLRHGKHTVQVKATDSAGNVSAPAVKRFKV
jgi:subtilisin family serine protease